MIEPEPCWYGDVLGLALSRLTGVLLRSILVREISVKDSLNMLESFGGHFAVVVVNL